MTQTNYIDNHQDADDELAAFNKEHSGAGNSFLELFEDTIHADSPYVVPHIESATPDIVSEPLHYENIELVFEDHNEPLRYIGRSEITGRPLPHAFLLDAFDIGIDDNALDSPSVYSGSSGLTFSDSIELAIKLIDEHYDYYGSMFSREMLEDIEGMKHLQSSLLVKSYATPGPHALTPIMGVNALSIALRRISLSRDYGSDVGNIFEPTKLKDNPDAVFTFDYISFASMLPRQHYMDAIFLSDHEEDEDYYIEEQAAYGVVVNISCIHKDEFPDYKPNIDPNPFQWVGMGHEATPPMWASLLHNHFADNEDYQVAAKACLQYPDIFAFWLAVASGLKLNCFTSFNANASSFHELSFEDKSRALSEIMPLVESVSLKMQTNDFLLQTPLINLYEL